MWTMRAAVENTIAAMTPCVIPLGPASVRSRVVSRAPTELASPVTWARPPWRSAESVSYIRIHNRHNALVAPKFPVHIRSWADVLGEAEHRHQYVQQALASTSDEDSGFTYLNRVHRDLLPDVAKRGN
jgi:hypothetical protein